MVEPITTANVGQSYFSTTQDVDPGILMMAVSLMHMNVAHESAKAKLGHLDETFATLGRLAPLPGKISQARNDVIQTELQASQSELAFTSEFQSRYVDNATISEADNQRFQEQQTWAAERGITLEDATKTVQEQIDVLVTTTDPQTGKEVTNTETRTITREVADLDAIARNEAKLESYQSAVAAGTADNAVIRELIADHQEIQAVEAALGELGHSQDLSTLSNLGTAVNDLSGWRSHLIAQIREHLASAKVVHQQLTTLSENWDPHLQEAAELHAQQKESDLAHSAMEQAALRLFSNNSNQLPDFLAALGDAIHETEQYLVDIEHTN